MHRRSGFCESTAIARTENGFWNLLRTVPSLLSQVREAADRPPYGGGEATYHPSPAQVVIRFYGTRCRAVKPYRAYLSAFGRNCLTIVSNLLLCLRLWRAGRAAATRRRITLAEALKMFPNDRKAERWVVALISTVTVRCRGRRGRRRGGR